MTRTRKAAVEDASPSARQEEVARATWRVIARDGLDKTSLRAIAHELGCTTGVLTHQFRDKNALLDFAFSGIVGSIMETPGGDAETWTDLNDARDYLAAFLPTNAEAKTWWRVWLSFTVAAFSDERLGANHARLYADLRERWAARLDRMRARGIVRDDIDPHIEAEALLCMLDGIGVQALISPRAFPTRRQLQLIDVHLQRLAPSSRRNPA